MSKLPPRSLRKAIRPFNPGEDAEAKSPAASVTKAAAAATANASTVARVRVLFMAPPLETRLWLAGGWSSASLAGRGPASIESDFHLQAGRFISPPSGLAEAVRP